MVLMPTLNPAQQRQALGVARQSIAQGLQFDRPLQLDADNYPRSLRCRCGNFATLKLAGRLRGCIGNLEGSQALVQDIATNAYNAAFCDPRFPRLRAEELAPLNIEISVLSEAEALDFDDESQALALLRPNIDGLILEVGEHHATFLPSVWEQLPTADQFLEQLKRKAGLPENYWSAELRLKRYQSHSFSEAS